MKYRITYTYASQVFCDDLSTCLDDIKKSVEHGAIVEICLASEDEQRYLSTLDRTAQEMRQRRKLEEETSTDGH